MGSACKHIFERFLPKRTSAFSLQTKKRQQNLASIKIKTIFAPHLGKCCTASSLRILQGLTAAKVVGCSGAMQRAYPPASLAQLARARDL